MSDHAETKPVASPTRARLRWFVGWVAIPAVLVSMLFGLGVHLGARHPDMWLSRSMMWLFG